MADLKAVRRYQASLERALALFDPTNEWADYIAFLSRLLKSLQGPPPGADLPLKSTIARHLSQCLRPSLPSGVHQKALEVYDTIFSIIGPETLGKDLSLYLPGLSHTLSFASLSTRPHFLALYDDHILSLPALTLRPALKALIMSMLPALEEETSEDFDRTLATFNRLRQKFTDDNHEEIFWQNLFLASITSPGRRAGALVYLIRCLPKLTSQSTPTHNNGDSSMAEGASKAIVTPEPGLLIRCFATGLQDPQPLVQRGFLDLLVTHLPLDAYIFADDAHNNDLDVLVNASAAIVLRRDMGLNRRLWAWYTGSETKTATAAPDSNAVTTPTSTTMTQSLKPNAKYFANHGLNSMIRSMTAMLNRHSQDPSQRARPFRIALSLMDRWEIGGPVVQSLFVLLLQNLQNYQATAPSQEAFDEVFRSANVFFDGIESKLIASQIISLLEKKDLDLVIFIVTNFNLEEEEMIKSHIPSIALITIDIIRAQMREDQTLEKDGSLQNIQKLGQILEDMLILIPPGVLHDAQVHQESQKDLRDVIEKYYGNHSAISTNTNASPAPSMEILSSILVREIFECLRESFVHPSIDGDVLTRILTGMDQCIALIDGTQALQDINFFAHLLNVVNIPSSDNDGRQYQVITGIATLITTLGTQDVSKEILSSENLCKLIPPLIEQLWYFLLSSKPQYHVEAVEAIWRLHALSRSLRLVESTIISLLTDDLTRVNTNDQSLQRFATLWIHSKMASKQVQASAIEQQTTVGDDVFDLLQFPLLQIIDAVTESTSAHPGAMWMRSLTSLNPLFGIVFQQLPKITADPSSMSITLQRLRKLIAIAKGNESQWKAFCGKSAYRDPVFELCSSLTSNQLMVNTLGVEALDIIQLLIGNDGIEIGDDILRMLSTRLVASYGMEAFQNSLLDTLEAAFSVAKSPSQPDYLLPILLDGIASPAIDVTLDKWITLLCTIVPLLNATNLFTNLLKITSCLCKRVELYLERLQETSSTDAEPLSNGFESSNTIATHPERSISNLLSGLEYVLARAHNQASSSRTDQQTAHTAMTSDLPTSRSSANDHLTVVLCMQDALKVCSKLWLWRSTGKAVIQTIDPKSLHYLTSRLRARSRRILENLIEAEPQECLETLMGLWVEKKLQNTQHNHVLELLQTLDGARPKFMMPATFNAIYNRTNPGALDQSQKSSLSVDVNAFELIAFLNDYTSALEDDLLDEIWTDCTTFLREVLTNPMPHRQILFKLLEFTAVLCRKMENTNFGEESRMRRELADLCARLFSAVFTTKPPGFDGSTSRSSGVEIIFDRKRSVSRSSVQAGNALQILYDTLPDLSLVLTQSDRLTTVYMSIATYITTPMLHSKQFPQNVSAELLALLQIMSATPAAIKAWRKDVSDAFNDAKFFQTQVELVELGWRPLIRQLALTDKAIMPEFLTKLTPPAVAGLMFGVGANAARTEADKRTQFVLRRASILMLSMDSDYFVAHLQALLIKLEELLTATVESSPSINSKADVYLTLRAIVMTCSQSHLSGVWPIIDNELRDLCEAMATKDFGKFTLAAQIQGAKLLDFLLLMKPDEFQLHEWLFVTDNMDAIYPPSDLQPVALADQIELVRTMSQLDHQDASITLKKKPWLCTDASREDEKAESLLAAFFTHLSIRTFEDNYSLQQLDMEACRDDIIKDLFNEATIQA